MLFDDNSPGHRYNWKYAVLSGVEYHDRPYLRNVSSRLGNQIGAGQLMPYVIQQKPLASAVFTR